MSDEKSIEGEAEHLFNMVKGRYGDRLSPEELDEVRKAVESNLKAAHALRGIELDPRDEPFLVFAPYRKEA